MFSSWPPKRTMTFSPILHSPLSLADLIAYSTKVSIPWKLGTRRQITPEDNERAFIVLSSVDMATMGTMGRYLEINLAISPVTVKHIITDALISNDI